MTPEQVRIRQTGCGGSEIAAIAGLPSFSTPIEIWRSKVEGYQRESTFRLELGTLLEPVVIKLLSDRISVPVVPNSATLKHPTLPLVATPDGFADVEGKLWLVEAKTCSKWMLADWGEDGTDQIPKQYFAQVQHTMHVMRACGNMVEGALVAVLVDFNEFRVYRVAYAPDVAQALADRACAWWAKHVETKTPPPPDGTPSYSDYLEAAYPLPPRGAEIFSNENHELWAEEFMDHKAEEESAERRKKIAQQHLVTLMGDAESVVGRGWRATWRADKNGRRTFRIANEDKANGSA